MMKQTSGDCSEWKDLADRLGKLEKQSRRLKQAGAVALIIAAAVLLMGQVPSHRTVEANEFILRDGNGEVRGRLSMGTLGPELILLGENGKNRVLLDHEGLSFLDANEKIRVMLGFWGAGPRLLLLDSNEETRAMLWATQTGTSLDLFDANRQSRALIGTTDVIIPRAAGETNWTYAASVILFDKDKKVLWQAP